MNFQGLYIILVALLLTVNAKSQEYALVIHGGAGWITPDRFAGESETMYRASLQGALTLGKEMLAAGENSVDVVKAVISLLENDSLFNAGRGAVLNALGQVECDASIMDGATLQAGAVSGVKRIKNPIQLAGEVMEGSPHVLLSGQGAEAFASQRQIELIENTSLITSKRWKQYTDEFTKQNKEDKKHGTVGAVALDQEGNLAAGTSTGGMFGKAFGRVGDSPIIGAGTYADNNTCAVSCTGHGEYFIRYAVAYDLAAMMAYGGHSVASAAADIIHRKLKNAGGSGGLIALTAKGEITMQFNTPGMFRGYATPDRIYVGLYAEE